MDVQRQVHDLSEQADWAVSNTSIAYQQHGGVASGSSSVRSSLHQQISDSEDPNDANRTTTTASSHSQHHGNDNLVMPSTSTPQEHDDYDLNDPDMDDDTSQSVVGGATSVKSQLAAALVARGNMDILMTSAARKRKQSSPQPLRGEHGLEGAVEEGPGPSKIVKAGSSPDAASAIATTSVSRRGQPGKMLPVHCIVEPAEHPSAKGEQPRPQSPTEDYAIVPSTLLLKELVKVALSKLQFPMEHVHNATGVLQIRNWKPLPLTAITDDPQATVGQIFGDLLSHITLKIKISPSHVTTESPKTNRSSGGSGNHNSTLSSSHAPLQLLGFNLKKSSSLNGLESNSGSAVTSLKGLSHTAQEIRLKLLQLLEKRGPTFLVSHGCPFSQGAVTQLIQGKYQRPIYMDKLQSFYQWYNIYNGLMDNTQVSADKLDNMTPSKPSSRHWRRPRTLFDPRHELPRLLAWYRDNPRPSRAEMEMYLAELNSTERRRNGHPLQYTSIAIWFKNARAKYRGLGRISPEPYDRMSMSPPGYLSDENINMYDSEPESLKESPPAIVEPKPKKLTILNSSNVANKPVIPGVVLTIPNKHVINTATSSCNYTPTSTNYSTNQKLKSAVAPLALTNMQLPSPQRQTIKVEIDRPASSAGGVSAQPTPEAASQVTDIRKIASGFGISLSPADAPPNAPSLRLQAQGVNTPSIRMQRQGESRTVQESAVPPDEAHMQRNGITEKHMIAAASFIKTEHPQQPTPLLQPKKITFNNLDMSAAVCSKATRKRFNIHPAIEVPKLMTWFAVNPKPDRHSIEQYVAELNATEFRRNQSKYDSRVVYVWFKNARAKYSRLKQRSPERGGGIEDDMEQTCELDLSMHSTGSRDGTST